MENGYDNAQGNNAGEKNPVSPCEELYLEDKNCLVASWFNDFGYPQKEFDEKILFFNSESILNRENILEHFKRDYKLTLFQNQHIEFFSRKGKTSSTNQDNFFITCDGKTKIMAAFDGHGVNGNLVSSFVMGSMLDYIKNS